MIFYHFRPIYWSNIKQNSVSHITCCRHVHVQLHAQYDLMYYLLGKVHISYPGQDMGIRGVFGQQFDPLVFERFLKFATKIAKMTGKE